MKKIFQKHQTFFLVFLLVILIVPTFYRMLKPGIFSTQDFHLFRQFEYEKCVQDLQLPCRFSPDVAFGFGEPLFNFYGQLPYLTGEVFRLIGFSFIDTLKALFIVSLVGSGLTMFLLSKYLWRSNLAGLISALVYVWAPYRSVDTYVRGALPEAMSFVFFPLIVYFFQKFLETKKNIHLLFLVLSFSALILSHNLSAVMFVVFFIPWAIYGLFKEKSWQVLLSLVGAGFLIFGICAFYLVPVFAESSLVTILKTTQGYFDFRAHFVTIYQLLISRVWGYGGSTWGDQDNLSLSVGQLQWILPVIILGVILVKRKLKQNLNFLIIFSIGWIALLLTHNKSAFLWEWVKPMAYIQFPWRFLELAVFCFAFASGALSSLFNKKITLIITMLVIISAIGLNFNFFREDIWFNISDQQQFSGERYLIQTSASINDYWPKYGNKVPTGPAPDNLTFIEGSGSGQIIKKTSNSIIAVASVSSKIALVQIPSVYFPGWDGQVDNRKVDVLYSGELGEITLPLTNGLKQIDLKFENTWDRTLGNTISVVSLLILLSLLSLGLKSND